MKILSRVILLQSVLLAGLWAGREFVPQQGERFQADELVVRLKPGVLLSQVSATLPGQVGLLRSHSRLRAMTLRVPPGLREIISNALGRSPLVEFVEPNRIYEASALTPSDTSLSSQWWLTKMQAADAWSLWPARFPVAGGFGPRPRVAILDSGADCTHADFKNTGGASTDVASGGQFSYALSQAIVPTTVAVPACPWQDDHGHGTHVAGIVAAATNNLTGVASLGFPAELVIYKVLDKNGSGSETDIADAIIAAADAGAQVISMSLGGAGYSQLLQDAVAYAWERNVVVIAAAGNSNTGALFFPAGANFVLGVGATDSADARASFSNFGFGLDGMAPGVSILSTAKGGGYVSMSGTSMAAPQVSALAALILAANPGLAAEAVGQRVLMASDPLTTGSVWNNLLGYGRINAWRSLSGALPARTVGGMVGQVVDSAGVAVASAQVTLGGIAGATDTYGFFRFVNLPAGTHSLLVSAAGQPSRSMTAVIPPGADTHARIALVSNVGTVTGLVSAAGGPPLGAAVVQVLSGGQVIGWGNTAANGVFSIQVPQGTFDLRLSLPGHVPQAANSKVVTSGGVTTVDFTVPIMGRVTGIVRDDASAPVAGAQVTVSDGITSAGAVTDAAGSYTTIGIPHGVYTVTSSQSGYMQYSVNGIAVADNALVSVDQVLNRDSIVTAVTLSPTTVGGGAVSTTNKVTLSAPAGSSGAVVTLSSSNTGVATVPASVSVPAGSTTSVPFTITTTAVSATTSVTIQASLGSSSKSAVVSVVPYQVTNLSLSPTTLAGGAVAASNRVFINVAAPPSGITVTLTSDNPALATPPASVVVPAGQTYSGTFSISTSHVATVTPVVLTAAYGSSTRQATLTLKPPVLTQLTLSPTSLTGGKLIGTASVRLDGPAPEGGALVTLQSSSAAVSPPASVMIAAGSTVSANFTIPTNWVGVSTPVILTASYDGVQKTANLTILPTTLSSISVPATVTGSKTFSVTVYLGGPASSPGAAVSLGSSDPAVTLPASVTVATGATSATVTASTTPVAQAKLVAVSATYGGVTKTGNVTVNPPLLSSLSVATTVAGGKPFSGTVYLTGAALPTGAIVDLSSSDPSVVLPASVTVVSGATSATFSATTTLVAQAKSVTVSASFGGVTKTASITVNPSALSSMYLSATVTGGKTLTGTVSLTGAAIAPGAVVNLISSDPALSVPASVTVAAGATSSTFTATAGLVAQAKLVTVSAISGGVTKSVNVTVNPSALSSMYLSATVTGGKTLTGTVSLTGAAIAPGAVVNLISSDPALSVPASVTVAAGATSSTFTATAGLVAQAKLVTVSAISGGVTKSVNVTVNPPVLSTMSISASVTGGKTLTGSVSLTGVALAAGAVVNLISSDPALSLPASVTVPSGATSATFLATAALVSQAKLVTVSADYGGISKSANVTVIPPVLSSLSLSTSVTGGKALTGIVYLTGVAPAPGLIVNLSSSDPAATVPTSIAVASGASSVSFQLTSTPVATTTVAAITAMYGGVSKVVNVSVLPPALSSLSLSPTTVKGGNNVVATISLTGAAPANGLSITTGTTSASAAPPPSVTIAPGATSATFPISTTSVAVSTPATMSVSYGGVSKTAALTIVP
ncbi:MAG: S8 family serine peptidase [Acidobacteriota bacterium]